jgi:hypothetical protein
MSFSDFKDDKRESETLDLNLARISESNDPRLQPDTPDIALVKGR